MILFKFVVEINQIRLVSSEYFVASACNACMQKHRLIDSCKRSDVFKRIERVIKTIFFFKSKTPSKYGWWFLESPLNLIWLFKRTAQDFRLWDTLTTLFERASKHDGRHAFRNGQRKYEVVQLNMYVPNGHYVPVYRTSFVDRKLKFRTGTSKSAVKGWQCWYPPRASLF